MGFAKLRGFFVGFLAPAASDYKIDHAFLRKIQWHDGIFGNAATLHEQDFEVGRNGQQLTKVGFCFFVNGHELFAAMAHFHHTHAAAMPVQHFAGSLN